MGDRLSQRYCIKLVLYSTPRGGLRCGDVQCSCCKNYKIDVRCTIQNAINLAFELPVSSTHYMVNLSHINLFQYGPWMQVASHRCVCVNRNARRCPEICTRIIPRRLPRQWLMCAVCPRLAQTEKLKCKIEKKKF